MDRIGRTGHGAGKRAGSRPRRGSLPRRQRWSAPVSTSIASRRLAPRVLPRAQQLESPRPAAIQASQQIEIGADG